MGDKEVEIGRYEKRAQALLESDGFNLNADSCFDAMSVGIVSPYLFFRNTLLKNIRNTDRVLEIGAGTGMVTNFIVQTGAMVVSTDISPKSVEFIAKAFKDDKKFEATVADMEQLPFLDNEFDVVISAGSLSYGDHEMTKNEIYRVLKKNGKFISVDSFNHNPIYRLNRYLHYKRGHRTVSTLKRMPNLALIHDYERLFGSVDARFFGSISWLVPFISIFLSEQKTKRISDWVDENIKVKKSAFKFVMVATKVSGN